MSLFSQFTEMVGQRFEPPVADTKFEAFGARDFDATFGDRTEVELNPQPLPPGPPDFPRSEFGLERGEHDFGTLFGRGDEVALSPQPLPPDPPDFTRFGGANLEEGGHDFGGMFGRGEEVAINPQPLPPEPSERIELGTLPPEISEILSQAGGDSSDFKFPDIAMDPQDIQLDPGFHLPEGGMCRPPEEAPQVITGEVPDGGIYVPPIDHSHTQCF